MEKVPEICLIAPSQSLADLAKKVALERGLNIGIYVAVLDEGLRLARQLTRKGAKIFVSRKGTAQLLAPHHYTVAKINTTLNDYLRHLDILKEHTGKMVIVEYDGFINELKLLCRYLGVENTMILGYRNAPEYEECVKKALDCNATSFMGGGASLPSEAKRKGIPYTVVENTYQSVSLALDAAVQLLNVQKREYEKQKNYKIQLEKYVTLVNHTHDAIINVDSGGYISIFNVKAQNMFSLTAESVGQNVAQLFPELDFAQFKKAAKSELNKIIHFKELLVSVNQIPVILNGQFEGAIYLFQSISNIQKSEQKIRLQLHQKGLTAKYHFEDILGESDAIEKVKKIAASYARTDSAILITGETGTGKELFAQSIHNESRRRNGPFVAINCATLPKDLLSSQLFGYDDGSFTGAVKGGKPGIFELAHGGTIFLDEIGEIPEETQVQLLRVLQEKEVRRLSNDKVIPVNVRVICATNKNRADKVAAKRFRMDLYYRINILKLKIPPLRERKDDIPLLVNHFLKRFSMEGETEQLQQKVVPLYDRLIKYSWPGNIRELRGVTERMSILLSQDFPLDWDMIMMEDFSEEHDSKKVSQYRREDLVKTLQECGYRKQKAASALGISRSTLWRLMKKYGLEDSPD